MKKTTFYTLMKKGGKVGAYKHDGYTDGTFNYYRGEYGTWYAIETNTGMSVCRDVSLKTVSTRAHNMLEAIERVKTTDKYKNDVKKFQTLVEGEAKGVTIIL